VRVQVQGEHFAFDDRLGHRHQVAAGDIRRVVAVRCEAGAVDEAMLLIETPGHAVIPAGASCAGWADLCAALDRQLPDALPFSQWHTRLPTLAVGEPLDIWPRPAAGEQRLAGRASR
jgi:hypothetical protein